MPSLSSLSCVTLVGCLLGCGGTASGDLFKETGRGPGGSESAPLIDGNPAQAGAASGPASNAAPSVSQGVAGPIRRVQVAQAASNGVTEVAFGAPTLDGSLLVLAVGVMWPGGVEPVSVPSEWKPAVSANAEFFTATSSTLFVIEGAAARPANAPIRVASGSPSARVHVILAEYAGLRAAGALDQIARGDGDDTGRTASTSQPEELWLGLLTSRDADHGPPGDGFAVAAKQGAPFGSMTLAERIVSSVGSAGTSFAQGGLLFESAGVTATFRR